FEPLRRRHHCNEHFQRMANSVCEVLLTEAPLDAPPQKLNVDVGAIVDFFGVVRKLEDGREIEGIEYQAHREMAEHQLRQIADRATEMFRLQLAIIHHRIGVIAVGERSLFLIAGLTDFIDGEIARRYGVITSFGKLMDPLVDKIMVAAAFISLVPLKAVPAWAATAVVARDFLITGLRLMATAKGRILPAESLGKQKTSWQIITIIFFLTLLSIVELRYASETSRWWMRAWGEAGPV